MYSELGTFPATRIGKIVPKNLLHISTHQAVIYRYFCSRIFPFFGSKTLLLVPAYPGTVLTTIYACMGMNQVHCVPR